MSTAQAISQDEAKRRAAARAAEFVRPGMRLGLGTGSTAAFFVDILGGMVRDGLDVVGVPTSERTRAQAASLGVRLSTLDETPELDLTVDGADEFDAKLRLIKGGGGALLREKIVAAASARMIVITDASKQVDTLGKFPLPVEVDRFGLESTRRHVASAVARLGLAGAPTLRTAADGHPFVTDGGHCILDCGLGRIPDPEALAAALVAIPGVVEHGLFIGLASIVVIADAAGVRTIGEAA
ncbi:MAG: ribose-5-phosphate isomerase RpiA [Hyphomicrobiales bacterium]|nr:ribose-5-phosphate isomerase RpiA [Hyphomicrobiales bacterium]